MNDVDETIKNLSSGVVLKAKTVRGEGTRDQDKVTGKIKGETIEEVKNQREDLVEAVEQTAEDLREVQPDEG